MIKTTDSKLAIAIDYATLRSLMLEYVAERARAEEGGDFDDSNEPWLGDDLTLERQLTLSGFLVWLRKRQRERNDSRTE